MLDFYFRLKRAKEYTLHGDIKASVGEEPWITSVTGTAAIMTKQGKGTTRGVAQG